ncbi:MAG: hypothetical protein LM589_01360 [Thermosphaera sp.]|nr:hypothetical protein [Thermosphaera sp.]
MSSKPREVYPPIHVIPCSEKSECPFFELRTYDEAGSLCLAYCRITERYLTRSFVKKCISQKDACPYKQTTGFQ